MQITDKKIYTASQILIKTLGKIGTEFIFGYPGRSIISIYDELSKQDTIKPYFLRHEQGVIHAAEGYSRVSGKCGVVCVTSGPGATNTITGLANAFHDGFPLLLITGQISSELVGKGAFQELDFSEMVKPCVKAVYKISSAIELESSILQAYLIATNGKKGPVVIEVPSDILSETCEYQDIELPEDKTNVISEFDIRRVIEALKSAKNPLVICGGGVIHADASQELLKFVSEVNFPVVSTMMGIGAFPENHPNYAGMIGVYGTKQANKAFEDADTLLVLGARFNDRVASAFDIEDVNRKTIIQIDINSNELIRNYTSDIPLNVDIKDFLNAILDSLPSDLCCEFLDLNHSEPEDFSENLTSAQIIKELYLYTKNNAPVIATEVGQHQISVIKNYKFLKPNRLLTSGGFGSMGFGFPAAIGASIALGKKPVILITGDGSFQMNCPELAVCKQYDIPVKILVMNNRSLGMVRQLQDEVCSGRRYETDLINPDFVKLAESYGIDAIKVESNEQIIPAFEKAFDVNKPYLLEFLTDSEENV